MHRASEKPRPPSPPYPLMNPVGMMIPSKGHPPHSQRTKRCWLSFLVSTVALCGSSGPDNTISRATRHGRVIPDSPNTLKSLTIYLQESMARGLTPFFVPVAHVNHVGHRTPVVATRVKVSGVRLSKALWGRSQLLRRRNPFIFSRASSKDKNPLLLERSTK